MDPRSDRRAFIVRSASAVATVVAGAGLAACGSDDAPPAEFKYGVASGDPLADRVILWTHAKAADRSDPIPLTWQVATDASFASVIASGRIQATSDTGHTAKVDAIGLAAGTAYFYRFFDEVGSISPVGTTRTLPKADATSVKFAVFSCSLYPAGFFNAYDAAVKSDAQYALHLGDYIYEYGAEATGFGNADAVSLGRVVSPAKEIVSLDDYRTRYAQYRADPMLQALHAKMPMIAVWDDHEFTNNAWTGGAENHTSATEGDWTARKTAAARAWHEWLPTRPDSSGDLLKIYRRFDFASLLTLHMLDTRIEGRDRQYDDFGDADGGLSRDATALATGADTSRRLISATQQAWLIDGVIRSNATWQVLGNQDIMARMWLPASVLQAQNAALASPTAQNQAAVSSAISAYLGAKAVRASAGAGALSASQAALLSTTTNPRLPYNLDAWDGYPSNREAILQTIKAQGRRLVTLSGDSHNGWFANLTTLAGEKVGVEFAGTSVTSPGFESVGLGPLAGSLDGSALAAQLGNAAIGAGLGLVDDLNYVDTVRRGYLLLTVTATSVKGEYAYVDTIKSRTYSVSVGRTVTVSDTGTIAYA
ncbi:MAG: alkaline phosphatase [Burkholderiales bacterium]|nr:MAG: alkaline phosphatase [Burkholderiales bacterium]